MTWRLRLLSRHIAPRGASLLSEAVIYVLQGKIHAYKMCLRGARGTFHQSSPHRSHDRRPKLVWGRDMYGCVHVNEIYTRTPFCCLAKCAINCTLITHVFVSIPSYLFTHECMHAITRQRRSWSPRANFPSRDNKVERGGRGFESQGVCQFSSAPAGVLTRFLGNVRQR